MKYEGRNGSWDLGIATLMATHACPFLFPEMNRFVEHSLTRPIECPLLKVSLDGSGSLWAWETTLTRSVAVLRYCGVVCKWTSTVPFRPPT